MIARATLIALGLALLPGASVFGATTTGFALATAMLFAVILILLLTWDRFRVHPPGTPVRDSDPIVTVATLGAAIILVFAAARVWLEQILIYPIDALRADMLVVIENRIRQVLQGRDPYTTYHVPWDATLPYGPAMWAPYIAPYLLHADLRFVSLIACCSCRPHARLPRSHSPSIGSTRRLRDF